MSDKDYRISAAKLSICLCKVGHPDKRTKCESCKLIEQMEKKS